MQEYKSLFERISNKLNITKKRSMIKDFSNKYKRMVGTSLCAAALLTSVHTSTVKADDNAFNFEKVFHVYVDGERMGSVDDKLLVERVIDNKLKEYELEFEDLKIVVGEDIQLIEEIVFSSKINNTSTIDNLKDKISVKSEAIALVVDGKEVGYVSDESDYKETIKNLKLQYVTEEELETFAKTNISEPEVGEKLISDVRLSKDIKTETVAVHPEEVLSIEDAIKQLNLGTLEDDIYIVQKGDVLGSIAIDHELPIKEILALNPSITENTLLQIGDELNVTVYEPIVKVIVEEATKVQEEIPFQTETVEDSSMWRGDTKEKQKGQNGERVVSYSITRENGRTINKQVVNETVTKEPVTRIILKGTKVSPSRGTGNFAWPAVGGYISSYQGMRWGRLHKGIDIARPSNRNILAVDNGTVTFAGWNGGYGKHVVINHNNGIKTTYSHMDSLNVRVGQTIGKGQKIGVMGTTGNVTGLHLHLEVYKNGKLVNPMDYLNK